MSTSTDEDEAAYLDEVLQEIALQEEEGVEPEDVLDEDEDEGRDDLGSSCVLDRAEGKPRVLDSKCVTCVFRPHNPMRLRPGRLAGMIREAINSGTWIICHSTLPYHPANPGWQAVCRGFYDSFGHLSQMLRIAERLGGVKFVHAPESGAGRKVEEETPSDSSP